MNTTSKSLLAAGIAFFVGLSAIAWVGYGYLGAASPLAFGMTVLIGFVYCVGGAELRRFHQATRGLAAALDEVSAELPALDGWLARLPASLQNPVRLRIEGERMGLPAPALTPYLVGLLVLMGMLGTFLGMVVTLNGAVLALESTTDLQTIRAALSAPVKGLGVAFGTSVAGVAASAMLGLVSTLCRRERLRISQLLDTRIATVLRRFSLAFQRQETFNALQQQARALPEVVEALHGLVARIEQHGQQLGERLLASQESHHRDTRNIYTELAASVDASLRHSLAEGARLAGETLRPAVESTLAGIARESAALQDKVASAVSAQLDGLSSRFDASVTSVSDTWSRALARHDEGAVALQQQLRHLLDEQAASAARHSAGLLASVETSHATLQAGLERTVERLGGDTRALHEGLAKAVETQLDGLARRFAQTVDRVSNTWEAALARHEALSERLGQDSRAALDATVVRFSQAADGLLASVEQAHVGLREHNASSASQQLAALGSAVENMAGSLQTEWQRTSAEAAAREQRLCATLEATARDIGATTQAQATRTLDEVTRLLHSAAEAPRAAAEVIAELRRELTASMARDNTMLEERSRILETLGTLLDSINHASTEQRGAIDALVSTSAALLEQLGARFEARLDAQTERIDEAAAQLGSSAVEVASLGEAFGQAVDLFSTASGKLTDGLQRVENALSASMARSDEQLAYYVAQAREVIDLSIMSQKRVVEGLRGLADKPAATAADEA